MKPGIEAAAGRLGYMTPPDLDQSQIIRLTVIPALPTIILAPAPAVAVIKHNRKGVLRHLPGLMLE